VQPTYGEANDAPHERVRESTSLICPAGATSTLNAEVSDPDGDEEIICWWQDREAGTSPLAVEMRAEVSRCEVELPAEAEPGTTMHIIVEATDSGTPALTRYQRVVVEIAGAGEG